MAEHKRPPEVSIAQVKAWFREAWPSAPRYPNESQCYSVAVHVNVVRGFGMKPPKRQTALEEALTPARKFLRLVPAAKKEISSRNNGHTSETLRQINGLAYPKLLYAQARIEAVEQAIVALLEVCEPIKWNDPARHIEEYVKEAWSEVPDSSPQLGHYPESPLVAFIHNALHGIPGAPEKAGIVDRLRARTGGGGRRLVKQSAGSGAKSPK